MSLNKNEVLNNRRCNYIILTIKIYPAVRAKQLKYWGFILFVASVCKAGYVEDTKRLDSRSDIEFPQAMCQRPLDVFFKNYKQHLVHIGLFIVT